MSTKPIPVIQSTLNDQATQMVDARQLHLFLESKQDYTTWIKRRIRRYGFDRNMDYLLHREGDNQ